MALAEAALRSLLIFMRLLCIEVQCMQVLGIIFLSFLGVVEGQAPFDFPGCRQWRRFARSANPLGWRTAPCGMTLLSRRGARRFRACRISLPRDSRNLFKKSLRESPGEATALLQFSPAPGSTFPSGSRGKRDSALRLRWNRTRREMPKNRAFRGERNRGVASVTLLHFYCNKL